jgi:hypothetical protein
MIKPRRFLAVHTSFELRLRSGRYPRCPVCGTVVGRDDALGIVDGRFAHAECTLLSWTAADRLDDRAGRDAADAGVADRPERLEWQWRSFLTGVLNGHKRQMVPTVPIRRSRPPRAFRTWS